MDSPNSMQRSPADVEFQLHQKWLIDPKLLYVGPRIGEGAHGKVYEGKCRDQNVAIKIVQKSDLPEEMAKRAITATFVCPLDVIKTRLQVHGLPNRNQAGIRAMVSEWMQKHKEFELETGDHATHIDLLAKEQGIASAEKNFVDLPEKSKNGQTHGVLLHCYVQEKLIEKVEKQFKKIEESGFQTAHTYNEMTTLYLAILF
ncbi:hypothetical protein KI387_025892 [Taxus chinensis]|uniref:Protein kinase domain-containing protein n=1 Tax=Taxus chinensis TaxID=29808 RepID=A0AA38FUT6_TAXCH|nr:hypothetical protein KI387_025892 [Taxus chinensis]